jgi:poly-gamma-glutamate synthesis protein (capsule biosynthesis protein)
VQGVDLAFGNLETPVAPDRGVPMPRISDNAPVFNAPTVLLDALHATGFDVLSLANNHTYDQERIGLEETLEHLKASPIVAVGIGETCAEAYAPQVMAAGDILIGWIGSCGLYNYDLNGADDAACVATLNEERVLLEAARARAEGAEIVVVSVHWGVEYATAPQTVMAEVARRLIDGGVDVILGHHPHVLQPVELHAAPDGRVGLIAFSLGNFISNQAAWFKPGLHRAQNGNPRDGLALQFDVVRKDYGGGIIETELANVTAVPLWTENNTHQRRGTEPVTIRTHVAGELLDASRKRMEAARASGDPEAVVAAGRELAWLTERRDVVAEIIGPGLLP